MTLQEPSSGLQSEALVFLSFFADLPDPRQAGKVIYPLQEVLLLCLLAVLAGAECFVEIARFGLALLFDRASSPASSLAATTGSAASPVSRFS